MKNHPPLTCLPSSSSASASSSSLSPLPEEDYEEAEEEEIGGRTYFNSLLDEVYAGNGRTVEVPDGQPFTINIDSAGYRVSGKNFSTDSNARPPSTFEKAAVLGVAAAPAVIATGMVVAEVGVVAVAKEVGEEVIENVTGIPIGLRGLVKDGLEYAGKKLLKGGAPEGSAKVIKATQCFVAGTPVATPDGWRNIEDIKEGDVVYAFTMRSTRRRANRPNSALGLAGLNLRLGTSSFGIRPGQHHRWAGDRRFHRRRI